MDSAEQNHLAEKFLLSSWWDKAGRLALYLLAFLIPLWALPFTSNFLSVNKTALSYFLIIAAFICWLISRIKAGAVSLSKNYLFLALILMVVVWFLSGIFSISFHVSFFGLNNDHSGFFAVFMSVAAAVVAYFYLRSPKEVFLWFSALFASAFLIFVHQFLRLLTGLNIFAWINFPTLTSNIFGSWNEFGILFSVTAVLSIFLFEVLTERKLRLIFLALFLISLAALTAVNNRLIWWVTFAFLFTILAYFLSLKPKRANVFRLTFFAMLLILLFLQVPSIPASVINYLGVSSLEVRPSWPASWQVIQKSLADSPILGSGPATFVYDWLRFKPFEVNESIFWATRFSNGAAYVPTLLATVGIAGFATFLFMVFWILYYGFKLLAHLGEKKFDPIFTMVLLGIFMILTYTFVYSPGFIMMLFLFLFLGMFMAFISEYAVAGEYRVILFQNSGAGFLSGLAIVFMLVVSFSGLYVLGKKYAAAYYFGRSLESGAEGNMASAEINLNKAVSFDERDDYFRAAAELELGRISSLLSRNDLPAEVLRSDFQNSLSGAIQSAKRATDLNPAETLNWISLGRVYEAVIPFKIEGASDLATAAYTEAAAKNPTSPEPLLAQARVALALNNLSKARELLEDSLKIKRNFTPAHFLLAQIEDKEGHTQQAISRSEAAVILSPDDLGALFQLGILYYRSNILNSARSVFERAVSINQNYSNARYFLGLVYDRLGDKNAAIEQFEAVSDLNPQNQEVKKILSNLRAGKSALSGITPPPEGRKEPPIKE